MITDILRALFGIKRGQRIPKEIQTVPENSIDSVDIGDQESEKQHEGLFSWTLKTDSPTSTYGGESNYGWVTHKGKRFYKSWRNVAGKWGTTLELKEISDILVLVNVYDNSYNVGRKAKPTILCISNDKEEWKRIGGFTIRGRDAWLTYAFPVGREMLSSTRLHVMFDDSRNYHSPESHFGKTMNWIAVIPKAR